MGWIKRNLFFAIGGLVALLLLGGAAYYDWQSWNHNSTAFGRLNEIYGKLKELGDRKPNWGSSKLDNIKTAKEQEQEVRTWIEGTGSTFKPITPIPNMPEVTSEAFAADLRRTIDLLQHEAESSSVQLPPRYGFSFEAQRQIVKFAGSLNPLAVQLGEVKTIAEILFAARVNALDSIQRNRASDDDATGPQNDYLGEASVTNSLAVLTPYVVTFRCFSPELAGVMTGFSMSTNGLIVKAINIAPAAAAQTAGSPMGGGYPGGYPGGPPGMPTPSTTPTVAGSRGGLPTVLNEQLLRVTLEVMIVKPLPKK
ncbi:MAG: hypothetical protein WDN00_08840 [Limisphaerales bacterium]